MENIKNTVEQTKSLNGCLNKLRRSRSLEEECDEVCCENLIKKSASSANVNFEISTSPKTPNNPKGRHHVQFYENVETDDSSDYSSDSSSSGSSKEEFSPPKAPDGGWGWVVVFASFMVNLIADGITFSFGVIYVELLEYFEESKSKTAWIGSLFLATPLLSGPLASYFTDRYGCRKVSIIGGILAAFGFFTSSFIESVEILFFTFGILSGFGLSLCYVAAVVIVAYYFDKRRSFATGLSVCGSGIGTFLFAPLIQLLIKEYGWRGTTLILSGLFLNLCVCGALMRDLEWVAKKKETKKRKRKRKPTTSSFDSTSQHSQHPNSSVEEMKKLVSPFPGSISEVDDDKSTSSKNGEDRQLFSSLVSLPTFVQNGDKLPFEVLEGLSSNRHLFAVLLHNYPNLLISSRSISDSGYVNEQGRQRTGRDGVRSQNTGNEFMNGNIPLSTLLPLNSGRKKKAVIKDEENSIEHGIEVSKKKKINTQQEKDINTESPMIKKKGLASVGPNGGIWWNRRFSTCNEHPPSPITFLCDLKVHRRSLTYRGAMLNIGRYKVRASSCPDIYRTSPTASVEQKSAWFTGLLDVFADMMNFSYFKNAPFTLFAISNFLLYAFYDIPYVYLADYSIQLGFTKNDSSYLISIIGILNMVGEILLGWMGDKPWINTCSVYAFSMIFCGLFAAVLPLLRSYYMLCIASGGFGLFVAANYSLTSIILVESISLEQFTSAYGLLLLVQGVANLVGPPLAGWLYDLTGSYNLPFYIAGFFMSISGVLLLVSPAYKKMEKKKCDLNGKSTDDE